MRPIVSLQNASKRIASLKEFNNIELLLSCEHGGNAIPGEYVHLFTGAEALVSSHRGYDMGALDFARYVSGILSIPLVFSETTRLLVDLNRSLHHRKLFSEFTRGLSSSTRDRILVEHYQPYRDRVSTAVDDARASNKHTIHLSIHSFTPLFNGQERNADIGLLYDPSRPRETQFCRQLRDALTEISDYTVRLNYPYRGTADGLTTALRKQYPAKYYSGIEIEINQKYADYSNTLRSMAGQFCAALGKGQLHRLTSA